MNYSCYSLYSEKLSRFFVGYRYDLEVLIEFHDKSEPRKFTYNAKGWKLYYKINCTSKKQGKAIEDPIKRMKSRIYIENLLKIS